MVDGLISPENVPYTIKDGFQLFGVVDVSLGGDKRMKLAKVIVPEMEEPVYVAAANQVDFGEEQQLKAAKEVVEQLAREKELYIKVKNTRRLYQFEKALSKLAEGGTPEQVSGNRDLLAIEAAKWPNLRQTLGQLEMETLWSWSLQEAERIEAVIRIW